MALVATPEASKGIWNSVKDALGLFSKTNKSEGVFENPVSIPADEYESSLSEEEIIELVSQWRKNYAAYYTPIDASQTLAFDYWMGLQKGDETTPSTGLNSPPTLVDNKIFESLETFLPIATRANPDPLVQADPSDMGQQVAKSLKAALVWEADRQKLRRKLARMTRHWALYRVGAAKISWDVHLKEIRTDIVNARRIVFDKDGHIDEGGNFIGEYIGEKKKTSAEILTQMFPKKKAEITAKCEGKMATKLEYYEWWYCADDVFFTLDDIVLGKYKNPNWNYDIEGKPAQESVQDEEGQELQAAAPEEPAVEGHNHHKLRKYPYVFLSIFNVGLHPHDDTSLILQNITLQDLVNRRLRQIDRNVDSMNNGMVVNENFTEAQAAEAANALRKGMAIRMPTKGSVAEGVMRFPAPPLPKDVFQNLDDARNELRSIFGTAGSSPEAMENQDTVRGKILVSQQDSSRIGGGVTEQLEQVADTIYNWWVQMMFVYYDEEHYALASGNNGGIELFMVQNQQFQLLQSLDITVKEGSLIPKDPLTQRNEAIDLWGQGAIDPLTFYKRLDFPDPVNQTQQLMLWQMFQKGQLPPQGYLPSFQINPQAQQMMAQAALQPPPGVGGPAVSPPANSTPPEGNPTPGPQTPEAVAAQSQQLIGAVPLPR